MEKMWNFDPVMYFRTFLLFLFTFYMLLHKAIAQPCVRIEALLVDACGTPEGENEMLRFKVGNQPLNTANMNVNWPSLGFLGICQNVATATKVAQINAGITGCGFVLEPPNGQLPPGASVVLVTSTNFNPSFNPFTNLNDTIYLIFQCAGNTQGHLANATSTGIRNVGISFNPPIGCSNTVSYDCQQLTDINGNTGTTGNSPADRDGASVAFPVGGIPIYYNNGCQAPIAPIFVQASGPSNACVGDTVWLQASGSNVLTAYQWSGGNGSWVNAQSPTPGYVISAADGNSVSLTVAAAYCNGQVTDIVQVNVLSPPQLNMTPSGPVGLCGGVPAQLGAAGNGNFLWSTGQSAAQIQVTQPGWYSVTLSNVCGSSIDSVQVVPNLAPSIMLSPNLTGPYCPGDVIAVTAMPSTTSNFQWFNGTTTPAINVNSGGWVWAQVSDACGTARDSLFIDFLPAPQLSVIGGTARVLCPGDQINLEAQGNSPVFWNTNQPNPIVVNQAGVFTATLIHPCGTLTEDVTVTALPVPALQLQGSNPAYICPGLPLTLNVESVTPVIWSTGAQSNQINVNQPGIYSATATNVCGSDSLNIQVFLSPIAVQFDASPKEGMAPFETEFLANWQFSNYLQWNVPAPPPAPNVPSEVTLTEPGLFEFFIDVQDSLGCVLRSVIEVRVRPNPFFDFYIPSAFTPNEDGINDTFFARGDNILRVKGAIFSRWGQLLYETGDIAHGWNGRLSDGSAAPAGVYIYRFWVTNMVGEEFPFQGKFLLIR
jgi:gliding motility-associated-like protein